MIGDAFADILDALADALWRVEPGKVRPVWRFVIAIVAGVGLGLLLWSWGWRA